MIRAAIFLGALAVTGCATTPWHWEKPGANQQDFNIDAGYCQAQAFSIPGAQAMQIAIVYDGCIQGRGWYKVRG